jgi:hypothetical protein
MADLDVQPKVSRPWWLWLLILLIVVAIAFYLVKGRSAATTSKVPTDTTTNK